METKSEMIRARVAPSLKKDAEYVLKRLGLSPTEAVTMFYQQIVLNRGIPFDIKIPAKPQKGIIKDGLDVLKRTFQ
jgi:DNA-damage-inducible protein J